MTHHENSTTLLPAGFLPHISLCSGYEGLGLGLKRALPGLVTVGYVEREMFAAANLLAKIEAGLLDAAPCWSDVTTFPYREFYPLMGATNSICTFGFPCQPHSLAGKRKGADDERWLFDTIADGLALMRPRHVFIENVLGLLTSRMPNKQLCIDYIFTRLAGLGYQMVDRKGNPLLGIFSAAEVGAPHQRKRIFILGRMANSERQQSERWRVEGNLGSAGHEVEGKTRERKRSGDSPGNSGSTMAHAGTIDRQAGRERTGRTQGTDTCGRCAGSGLGDPEKFSERESPDQTDTVTDERRARPEPGSASSLWDDQCGMENAADSHGGLHARPIGEGTAITGRPGEDRSSMGAPVSDRWPAGPGQPQHEWEPPRTLPTQPRLGRNTHERTCGLDGDLKNENIDEIRAGEVLLKVWNQTGSKEVQWTIGGLLSLLEKEVLRSGVRLCVFPKRISFLIWAAQAGHQVESFGLRKVRLHAHARNSPQGQGPVEQFRRELIHALCELSYEIALARGQKEDSGKEAMLSGELFGGRERARILHEALQTVEEIWQSVVEENIGEKSKNRGGLSTRIDRLRLLGNGCVPATVELAWRTLSGRLD